MIDYHKQENLPELRTLTKLSLSNKIQAEHAKMLMPRICQDYFICYLFAHVAMHELRCLFDGSRSLFLYKLLAENEHIICQCPLYDSYI